MRILMYHRVDPVSCRFSVRPEPFEQQAAWLAGRGEAGLTLRDALGLRPRRAVVLTFDDGFADTYTEARPILDRYGLTATIFVVTDLVGQRASWRNAYPAAPLLDWAQMREMAAGGYEFGSHTATHLDVRPAGDEEVYEELVRSKAVLEEQLGQEVVSFAYPYGYFRPALPELLARAGYRCAVLAGGYRDNGKSSDVFGLSRTPVWGEDSIRTFQLKARGWLAYRYYTEKLGAECRYEWKRLLRRCGRGRQSRLA